MGELVTCLICGSQCQHQIKRERIIDDEDDERPTAANHDHLGSGVGEEHLMAFFVLSKILKVPKDALDQLNCGDVNDPDPLSEIGTHVPLCLSCGERARQFHEAFEEIARLQVILNEVQAEFLEKIQMFKDVQCQGSGFTTIWDQIRYQALLNTVAGGSAPPAQEADDDFGGEWHVKEEIPSEPDGEEGTFEVITFPRTSQGYSPVLDDSSTLDVEDKVSFTPSKKPKPSGSQRIWKSGKWLRCPNCPYRTGKMERMDAHVPLHEEGSQAIPCDDCGWFLAPDKLAVHQAYFHNVPRRIRKERKKSTQPVPILFQCAFCPHNTNDVTNSKRHQKFHQAGSGATACEHCGIFVTSSTRGFIAHRNTCAHAIKNSLGQDAKLSGVGKIRKLNTSNPRYVSFNRGQGRVKRKQYECRQCPYETMDHARIKVHVELHEEGSQAVSCEQCGWLLPPGQMEAHLAVNHAREETPKIVPAPGTVAGTI